jgi:hypothetical protein
MGMEGVEQGRVGNLRAPNESLLNNNCKSQYMNSTLGFIK